jgi:protein TonB
MFDIVSGGPRHPFHKPTIVPTVASIAGHGIVLLALAGASFAVATDQLPALPDMMAFVTAAPAPAPPPPPPPPPARRAAPAKTQSLAATRSAAPVEAPAAIVSEVAIPADEDEEGVEGGVEGGIAGGMLGGVVGGLLAVPLPPPPPPPAPVAPPPSTPVRIGGQLTAPALLHRVNPVYPDIAVHAKVTGTVILEATVDIQGKVESVRILRSIGLLNNAAIEAVMQWRYSPLALNGVPTPFVLTVTLSFSLQQQQK